MATIDYEQKIPNNVDLKSDKKLQRALEKWQPDYIDWWRDMGPTDFNENEVFLRTAVSVDRDGWAQFEYVRMPEYRWGIFLQPDDSERTIPFGDHMGEPAWQQVPGEYRNMLRRIIVTQGDTEPASVEQQRLLGLTAPSLYDLRNLFQVNVEEGRHLWAMVYLLHGFFGRDGREEADELLERRSGNPDHPRILGTFNEPCRDWLSFFCFTTYTDRDGKFQLLALAESGFDPLARTCRFMLTEEAHHMFVGQTGIGRVIERTCQLMNEHPDRDVKELGGIPLDIVQRYINFWSSSSNDLFGGEISSNAANFFGTGLKGRANEAKLNLDHKALEEIYSMEVWEDGRLSSRDVPLRNAMNEVLRDEYVNDNEKGIIYFNKIVERHNIDFRFSLPHRRFNRRIGMYSEGLFDLQGNPIDQATWERDKNALLPSREDREHVASLMKPCHEQGKIAGWIAPPQKGIDGRPFEYEYVKL
jgi:benzoyl-CoA 2,3-dioxygenase component B